MMTPSVEIDVLSSVRRARACPSRATLEKKHHDRVSDLDLNQLLLVMRLIGRCFGKRDAQVVLSASVVPVEALDSLLAHPGSFSWARRNEVRPVPRKRGTSEPGPKSLRGLGRTRPHLGSEQKTNLRTLSPMAVRSCKVTIRDREGIDPTVDVTAETLFEAAALGISAMRSDEWTTDVPQGLDCVQVEVTNVPVKHEVRMRDFLAWLERPSGLPRELTYRKRIKTILGMPS